MSLTPTALDTRIQLRGLLGAGGMGEVHRAWDAALERPVAVKFVHGTDPKEADRLLLEARLQARVEHPNVVRVHDTGTLQGRPCIVMQLVEGSTLADLAPQPDWRIKVRLAAQAARGLAAAHQTGLVHRDVKPANILVEEGPEGLEARLSDFGLARDEEGGLTRSGLLVGSVDFMAPEQVAGSAPVDFRADVYGLGATLYAVLAGRPPFRPAPAATAEGLETVGSGRTGSRGQEHPGELIRRVLEETPRSLRELLPSLPRDLQVAVAKAMEKEPGLRYGTAEAFAEDLERVLRGEPILARPVSLLERGLRWSRRNPVAARALGAGLAAVIAAASFSIWNSRRSTLAALGAAQLGGEAKALELRLKMAHLAPAHDLRPVLAGVEASLLAMDRLGRGPAAAAAAYARGRVRLLLDRLPEARKDLEMAERSGFRGAELHEALGLVYGKLYQQELPSAEAISDADTRKRRLAELQEAFRTPALAHLEAAGDDPMVKAHVALLKGQYDEARAWARKAREWDPERLESTLFAAQVWEQEGNEAFNRREGRRALVCAKEGLELAQGLTQGLRSDPAVPFLLGRLKDLEAAARAGMGEDVSALVREGLAHVDQSLRLNPDLAKAWIARASLLGALIMMEKQQIQATSIRHAEEMVVACQRAVALAPEWGEAHLRLAWAHQNLGNNRNQQGLDPGANYQDGYRAGLEAVRLQPWNAACLHMALSNLIGEVATKLDDGRHPGDAVAKALETCRVWGGFPGVVQGTVQTTLGELRIYQARSLWFEGKDPDPVFAQAMADMKALLAAEPDQVGHLNTLSYAAYERLRARALAGRSGEDVVQEVLPLLEAGIRRHPSVPVLKLCRAQLLSARLMARPPKHPLYPAQVQAASRAVASMLAVLDHPGATELRGWTTLAQAEAGARYLAPAALADFQRAAKGMPAYRSPKIGEIRALRVLGTPRALSRALELTEKLVDGIPPDPEPLLLRALLLKDLGRPVESEAWRSRALAVQPLLSGSSSLNAGS